MTGSGTLLDPYIIQNVNDLQAVQNDPLKYYELGNDIDATATSGWNGGHGFIPLDSIQRVRPNADQSSVGVWTIFPAAPATKFDKVNEPLPPDGDASYIKSENGNETVMFLAPAFNIPAGSVSMAIRHRFFIRGDGTGNMTFRSKLRVGGVDYQFSSSETDGATAAYRWVRGGGDWTKNPATGLNWIVADLNGTGPNPFQGFGVVITGGHKVWITEAYLQCQFALATPVTFDGKGHKITSLFMNHSTSITDPYDTQTDYGLFSAAFHAEIKNLELDSVDFTMQKGTGLGGIAGTRGTDGTVANLSAITNCKVSGTLVTLGSSTRYGGGIIGWVFAPGGGFTISACTANVVMTGDNYDSGGIIGNGDMIIISDCQTSGSADGGLANFGGIAGELTDSDLTGCSSSMTFVTVLGYAKYAGGLVGLTSTTAPHTYSRCFATGNLSFAVSNFGATGGLVGYNDVNNTLSECFATGNVTSTTPGANDVIGGLVGENDNIIIDCYARGDVTGDDSVGGLVGANYGNITNTYSTGKITGNTNFGGLIGFDGGAIYADCFWDTDTSGLLISGGGIGKTTAELHIQATYTGFAFPAIWLMVATCNDGYACLVNTTIGCIAIPPPIPVFKNLAYALGRWEI